MGPGQEGRAISPAVGRCHVLAAACLWSLGGVITKSLMLDPLAIAFYRGLFAGLVLVPLVPRSRWAFRPALIPLGLVFGAMTGLYLGAVKATTAANAIYLQYTSTFWTVPLSALFLGERPDRRALAGIALAMVGIAVIVGFGYDGRPNEWQGIALGLASGLGYAGVTTGMRGLRALDPVWLSGILNLAGAVALGAWIVAGRGAIPLPSPPQALTLVVFGAVQMAIPYALFARGLARDRGARGGPDRAAGADPGPDLGRPGRRRVAHRSHARRGPLPPLRGGLPILAAAPGLARGGTRRTVRILLIKWSFQQ